MSRPSAGLATVLATVGLWLTGGELWLAAKGRVAAVLIDHAFELHLADGAPHRPWPWADVVPVARLEVPRLGVRRPVLSGATGAALAFGLGHLDGTARPGDPGNVAIGGHRDGAAAFMARLVPGDEILLLARDGTRRCAVFDRSIVPHDAGGVLDATPDERLTLVTCWPFSGFRRSPWRYVVVAECGPPGVVAKL